MSGKQPLELLLTLSERVRPPGDPEGVVDDPDTIPITSTMRSNLDSGSLRRLRTPLDRDSAGRVRGGTHLELMRTAHRDISSVLAADGIPTEGNVGIGPRLRFMPGHRKQRFP